MRNNKEIFLVIPTIRDLTFLKEWQGEFENVTLLVIEDREKKSVVFDRQAFKDSYHYDWSDIAKDLGPSEWIISRKNAGIRSYGFWKAWRMGAEVIMTLDDDCYPTPDRFVEGHMMNLKTKTSRHWQATYPDPDFMYTRGFPYSVREEWPVMISHGLWSGALDLDGKTESKLPKLLTEKAYPPMRQIMAPGLFYPMCSMNLAFNREAVPIMFFPMMGSKPDGSQWGFDRFDDIWAGLFSKKIMDHLGWAVINGSPFVEHRKASLPGVNEIKEVEGVAVNETLWQKVDEVTLTATTAISAYRELAEKMVLPQTEYFQHLRQAMILWTKLFED